MLPGAGGGAVQHHTLSVNGVLFDEAEINSSGAFQNGAYFALFDNVRINVIPEPPHLRRRRHAGASPCRFAGVAIKRRAAREHVPRATPFPLLLFDARSPHRLERFIKH